jgi:hypothetical protein
MCPAHFLAAVPATGQHMREGRRVLHEVDVTGCDLDGVLVHDVVFTGMTHFDDCRFTGETRFENVTFDGFVSFRDAVSDGRMAFRDVRFTNLVDLGGSDFAALSIRRTEFDAAVVLGSLCGDVDLHLATFERRMRLEGAPRTLELRQATFRDGARLRLDGSDVTLNNVEFGGPSSLGPHTTSRAARPRLLEVADTGLSRLTAFATDLSRCTFVGAHDLDGFAVDALDAFAWAPGGPYTRRRVLWDECRWRAENGAGRAARRWRDRAGTGPRETPLSARQVARDYRALRKAREDAKDEPGAADLYYGEMEMRRLAAHGDMRAARHGDRWGEWVTAATEHSLLWLYWAVSGYGLRAWRALVPLLAVVLGGAVLLRYTGYPGGGATYGGALRLAVQAAMSLVRGVDEPLTPAGEWTALALRLLGPLLLGLALLAMRGRVRR